MIVGGAFLPIGCFWFAWSNINPWPQIIAGVPLGAGLQMIFLQVLTYLINIYLVNANSAISANVFIISWCGAGFTMFATPMYHGLAVSPDQVSYTEVEHVLIANAGELGNNSTRLLEYCLLSSAHTFLCIFRIAQGFGASASIPQNDEAF